ncbi:XkdQ/YqbQ family protein [Paenibacillus flagellatus]|uniref:YqbQ/XkdQ domain-containing protein n=1 Tax=Paenibacillus flagellatus TaxID=2211139 RepID=A0A2V5KXB4_9BACL|nr:hypothetical protein [Paenibacillus flagellatus]PYI57017.1 hypothetical protein DLM86_00785 [Paenibacillus flagellatus]
MRVEISIDNRDGNVWDLSGLVPGFTWRTARIGKAGSLTLSFVKGGLYESRYFAYNPGDVVRVRVDDRDVFYGYIFGVDTGKDEEVTITAYDQMRYMMTSDTYVFQNTTATEIIRKIASDFGLTVGELADTGYAIPAMVEDGSKLLDIACKALDLTLTATQQNFVLYDDFGSLTLRNVEDMALDVVIGDRSLLFDYKHTRSIDSDSYNRIMIVQDNKKTGRRDLYITQDSSTIARWGLLQLYQKADENMNEAQIIEAMNNLIELKNRETRTFRLEAIGDLRVRAGSYIIVDIAEFGLLQYCLVDECIHKFEGADHTMELELKVYG